VRFFTNFSLIIFPIFFHGQIHYRISADFSIKESNGKEESLIAGKIYYDLQNDILVYDIFFPEKVDWVIHDTSFFMFSSNDVERYTIPKINSENILHLSLTNSLNDYGLMNSGLYKLVESTNEEKLLISTYEPKTTELRKHLGKVIISLKEGRFNGIVFFNEEEDLIKKIIVQEYQIKRGVVLPNKIIEVNYTKNNNEIYKLTTFSNFILNEKDNEQFYNYNINKFNN